MIVTLSFRHPDITRQAAEATTVYSKPTGWASRATELRGNMVDFEDHRAVRLRALELASTMGRRDDEGQWNILSPEGVIEVADVLERFILAGKGAIQWAPVQ